MLLLLHQAYLDPIIVANGAVGDNCISIDPADVISQGFLLVPIPMDEIPEPTLLVAALPVAALPVAALPVAALPVAASCCSAVLVLSFGLGEKKAP